MWQLKLPGEVTKKIVTVYIYVTDTYWNKSPYIKTSFSYFAFKFVTLLSISKLYFFPRD